MNDNIGSQFRISTRLLHNGKLVILTYYSKIYLNFTYFTNIGRWQVSMSSVLWLCKVRCKVLLSGWIIAYTFYVDKVAQ